MSKKPIRELRVLVNRADAEIEIVLLANGGRLGDIKFTRDEAEKHARVMIEAIEMLHQGKSGLIIPQAN